MVVGRCVFHTIVRGIQLLTSSPKKAIAGSSINDLSFTGPEKKLVEVRCTYKLVGHL